MLFVQKIRWCIVWHDTAKHHQFRFPGFRISKLAFERAEKVNEHGAYEKFFSWKIRSIAQQWQVCRGNCQLSLKIHTFWPSPTSNCRTARHFKHTAVKKHTHQPKTTNSRSVSTQHNYRRRNFMVSMQAAVLRLVIMWEEMLTSGHCGHAQWQTSH